MLQHGARHADPEPLPANTKSTTNIRVASEPETHAAVTAPVQSSEAVVSVGDALVAIPQGRELVTSEDEMQQPPVTLPTNVPRAGPSRLHESISSRIHKGSCISVPTYLTASCMPLMLIILIGILWAFLQQCKSGGSG